MSVSGVQEKAIQPILSSKFGPEALSTSILSVCGQ